MTIPKKRVILSLSAVLIPLICLSELSAMNSMDEDEDGQCDSIANIQDNSHYACPPESIAGQYLKAKYNRQIFPPSPKNKASKTLETSIDDCSFNVDQTLIECPNGKTYILNSTTLDSNN